MFVLLRLDLVPKLDSVFLPPVDEDLPFCKEALFPFGRVFPARCNVETLLGKVLIRLKLKIYE